MRLGDARCNDCNHIFLVSKKSMENWSELEFICPECDSTNTGIKFGLGGIDIALGLYGNSHTKYDREFTYKHSRYGKFKGIKMRSK